MSDLFADPGLALLERLEAPAPYLARVGSLRRLIDDLDVEIDLFARLIRGRLVADPGYRAVQTIPGIGPVLAAVFVAEVGDVHRFPGPAQLTSWAGLTPKHHESDTHVHRGRITKQGSRLVRWAAIESVRPSARAPAPGGSNAGSGTGVVATSARPPPPASSSGTCTTPCGTGTCGP
jgi:transposase